MTKAWKQLSPFSCCAGRPQAEKYNVGWNGLASVSIYLEADRKDEGINSPHIGDPHRCRVDGNPLPRRKSGG